MNKLFPFQGVCCDKLAPIKSVLIGDDMGLGKTIEAIEIDKRKRDLFAKKFTEVRKGKAMTLVVAPLSVLGSWAHHFKVWQPDLKVCKIDNKNRKAFTDSMVKGQHDVYLLHWEALRLIPELQKIFWFHVIADEAHRAKNRKAQQTVALKKLFTEFKLAASGTPADNKPDDFWSILNWLYPRVFSSYWQFRNYHVVIKRHDLENNCGCDKWHQRAYDEVVGTAHVDELMTKIEPFYVRRLKDEVWDEMPEKIYTQIEVDLHPVQRRAYEDMRKTMLAWVGQHENEPIAAPVVIAQLTRLQQFACAHARFERVVKKRTSFCNCGDVCKGHAVDVLKLDEPSSKLDAVMELIEDNEAEQFVVFGQSKQVINMLAKRLAAKHIPVALLTGDTKQNDRTRMVEDFQAGKLRVFAGTIAAGGVGITLTAASRVIFIDRAWSPSINRQAEDRLHRIGQKNAVQIIDIIARNTLDVQRLERIELKWEWIKEILGDKPVPNKLLQELLKKDALDLAGM